METMKTPIWSKRTWKKRLRPGHRWAIFKCYVTGTPFSYYTIVQAEVDMMPEGTQVSKDYNSLVDECNDKNRAEYPEYQTA
jgi:hypothetical protein